MTKPIEITTLPPEAARVVLLERSGRSDDGCAEAVAKRLGYLPLALVQAGAYMEVTGCSFGRYLERLEQVGLVLFEDHKAATGDCFQQTVAATWLINLDEIRRDCPVAADLLDWLAFLDPDGVPVRLLCGRGEELPQHAPVCLKSEDRLDDAVAALRRYSMVDRVEQPEDALRVHRLVQAVTRENLGDERRRLLVVAIMRWVQRAFAYEPDVTPIKDVPEGIGEQLMALSTVDVCVAMSGHTLTLALGRLVDYFIRRGMLAAARAASERSLDVAERQLEADPHSAQAQRALAAALSVLGDVEVLAGNLAVARDFFRHSLGVAEGLAKANPNSAQAQRDHALSLDKLGEVEVQAGNLAAARDFFQSSFARKEELAKANPQSAQVQRSLAVSLERLGDVEVDAGNLVAGRDLFQRGADILEGLAKVDPNDAQAQRDYSVSLNKLGEVEAQAGNLAVGRDLFQRSLQMRERLAKADPQNAQAQRDVYVSFGMLGNVEVEAGNLAAARDLFQCSLQAREELVKSDPHSAQAALDLCSSHKRLALVAKSEGDRARQSHHLRAAKVVLDVMEARGQYRGYAALDRDRRLIDGTLDES